MTDQQKYLLLAAVGVGGLAYWYFNYGPGAATTPIITSTVPASPPSVVPAPPVMSQAPYTTNQGGTTLDTAAYNWILAHPVAWYTPFFNNVFPHWNQNDVSMLDQILALYSTGTPLSGALLSFWNQWFPGGTPI